MPQETQQQQRPDSRTPKWLGGLTILVIVGFISLGVLAYVRFFLLSPNTGLLTPREAPSTFESGKQLSPSPTAVITPQRVVGTFACDPAGICNSYANPQEFGCPKTYKDVTCLGQCGQKEVRCLR